tara:strand:- start:288 stop:1169 length:882 start_codon:yes stop_codon:yes gene_type:complete
MSKKLAVAVIGSGNIGIDLLIKIQRSPLLECALMMGRNLNSHGMVRARELGVRCSDRGIHELIDDPGCCELVFDATSARAHLEHWDVLRVMEKKVIDMTPSQVGMMAMPAINLENIRDAQNVNMVSCGGQASVPIAYAIAQSLPGIEYIEIVSSIAAKSAGAATRANLDEYVETTEAALCRFTGCRESKTLLNLNPAEPPIFMQTTISLEAERPDLDKVRAAVDRIVDEIRDYVPGYEMIVPPVFELNRIVVIVKVAGCADYLPAYAGNLDIINCAAIRVANVYAQDGLGGHD